LDGTQKKNKAKKERGKVTDVPSGSLLSRDLHCVINDNVHELVKALIATNE
jgi:hypothetical protein